MKSTKNLLLGIFITGSLAASLHFLHAQETATPVQSDAPPLTDANVDWTSASDLEVMLQAVESVTPAPAATASKFGTFYSAQHAPGTRNACHYVLRLQSMA